MAPFWVCHSAGYLVPLPEPDRPGALPRPMTLHEPSTLLTDYAMAAFTAVLAVRLRSFTTSHWTSMGLWARGLLFAAVAAAAGGTYHGLGPEMQGSLSGGLWTLTLLLIGLTSVFLSLALITELCPARRQQPWRIAVGIKFAALVVAVLLRPVFLTVVVDYGVVLLAFAIAALAARRPWSGGMLGGVGLSIVAVAVQQLGWSPSAHFNHNDVYHVIQTVAFYLFYRAGRKFSVTPVSVTGTT